ncbi:dynein assembly factor axonemal [Labeo rohita]|uniref:Dynein assembly factor axonemal n=1 Tax=Labeo rohita TaxID=84645 RepID=A0A498NZU7_LABRO|nr:dynein assembly factor axonemal [Labeo rohita]
MSWSGSLNSGNDRHQCQRVYCGIISKHQYVKWRESGVAFEMREGLYQTANQSLLSTRVFSHRGDRVAVRGYWGDIVSSPYLSFGIETENKDLLKKHNNQHVKTAQDISEVNILGLFECLSTRGSSLLNEDEPKPSRSCCQSTDNFITDEKIQNDSPASQTHTEPEQHPAEQQTHKLDLMNLSGVKVSFLSPDSLNKLPLKSKYRNLFNTIFCSASMVHQLDSSLTEIAAPDAALVIELAKYLLDLSKEQVSGFADRVKEIAEESGFTATHNQSKKTEVFLEVFGNSEIRKETEETLKHAAAQLSLSITNTLSSDSHTHPCLDTSLLKFKERDELVRIFKQWERPPSVPASVRKVWDARVRQHLGTRYDSRQGCFDWDLTMKLHQSGCGIISKHQYVKWRESGVAFEMREGLYQTANQSLLSTRVFSHRGDRVAVRGYWGDIVSSPYLSFGIETENKDLLKKHNNQHVKYGSSAGFFSERDCGT